jgi:hypothetical protein
MLSLVLGSKSVFDTLDELELRKARGRCNPFESIGKMFFQNRAALKMANIDAACDFMFTQPKTQQVSQIFSQKIVFDLVPFICIDLFSIRAYIINPDV